MKLLCLMFGHFPIPFRIHGPDSDPIHRWGARCDNCGKKLE